ncbi:hypothetical protein, variant [Aphanomyces invadans]|uniref:Fungal lipase-type domain-containing protein n=1 Tax=Aphanomyces invadans TaxID=157072 RepID=A0A024UV32_9STRA|nr:hypothetical protein, variant [Aphanomyces invadans]ETW09488.1 hypothetical protein, variant [Aphanomyces invadans]|eukprot:XP_008860899.1 hypothetical protein, variant [Aphanomyces invadans]
MEFWGTLQKTLGGGAVPADSDAYVNKFFDNTVVEPSWAMDVWPDKLKQFVTTQLTDGRRIALVTCGSATVPLPGDSVMDAVSFGDRGAASAEHFLRAGYAVIFLHREGSLAPFSRHFQLYIRDNRFLSMLRVDAADNSLHVDPPEDADDTESLIPDLSTLLAEANETKSRLMHITFTTVQQYLFYLRMATTALDSAASRGLILLSASILDYYVPSVPSTTAVGGVSTSTTTSPPPAPTDSSKKESAMTLNLVRIPNLIAKIRREYAPKACLVTLKSVADKGRMQSAAFRAIERWGVDIVVADSPMLPNELALISAQEEFVVSPHDGGVELEVVCAAMLVEMHRAWSTRRQILKQGKALLLLTAKFSMMKENDTLNEDAMGNKNVPFKRGIRIRTDRHRPSASATSPKQTGSTSPVYELDAIFQNKSHCARAHVWKRVADCDDSVKEIMVAFSPAGNPETIRSLWGDLWNGWDEHEIADFKEQIGHVTLSSALYGLAQGVTATVGGDYSHAHAMLGYIYSKLGTAWSEGEQTRIRQSFENMVAVNFNRGLMEMDGLNDIEDLRQAKAMAQCHAPLERSNTMTSQEAELVRHSSRRRRKTDSFEVDPSEEVAWSVAASVRVHKAIKVYFDDMVEDGILDAVLPYVKAGYTIDVTGYSMGGMLGQLFLLKLGDLAFPQVPATFMKKIHGVFFGTPRVGDAGFAARMKILYGGDQLLNVMHPLDTVHAYPPTSEGYADAMLKVFLKEDGINRRTPSAFSVLPVTRAMDKLLEKAAKTKATHSVAQCKFCHRTDHQSEQHRCRYCTRRGDHRGSGCPHWKEGCALCGNKGHSTGEHRCSVCSQFGHRGRECHTQGNVGMVELLAYFRFHHYLYYNSNLKQNVEFSSE